MIDFILCRRNHTKNIKNCKVIENERKNELRKNCTAESECLVCGERSHSANTTRCKLFRKALSNSTKESTRPTRTPKPKPKTKQTPKPSKKERKKDEPAGKMENTIPQNPQKNLSTAGQYSSLRELGEQPKLYTSKATTTGGDDIGTPVTIQPRAKRCEIPLTASIGCNQRDVSERHWSSI